MKEQLPKIPAERLHRLCKRQPRQRWKIVAKTLRRDESNWILPHIADILNGERVKISRAQQGIVLRTLFAMRIVREVFGSLCGREHLLHLLQDFGVG
ncbi:MAG TPA: hypothetical protein GYA07_10495 [Verrucomicrobia bacterium]|nr:hypothetical protein [Verrucomicrobiota bacterium]HOP97818.1 hypothetical protein [Verrucomicrobiota bacterium]HPU55487.1 hypothetical protein [Verrucomicrobiota bacterium]